MKITESVIFDFIFNAFKFDDDIYSKDTQFDRNRAKLSNGKVVHNWYTVRIYASKEKYIFNISDLDCVVKILDKENKLIAEHDCSDLWSVYHAYHVVRIDEFRDMVNASIVELQNMLIFADEEMDKLKINLELHKKKELIEIVNARQLKSSKKMIQKMIDEKLEDTTNTSFKNSSVNIATEDNGKQNGSTDKSSSKSEPKDYGV